MFAFLHLSPKGTQNFPILQRQKQISKHFETNKQASRPFLKQISNSSGKQKDGLPM